MRTIMNKVLIFCFCLFFQSLAGAQTWEVPEDKADHSSPFLFDEASAKEGAVLFKKYCQQCHGEPGRGNFAKITPEPGDVVSEKFRKQKDGELFFRISNGRGPMPRFSGILKENERWQVISFIRTFHEGYLQAIDSAVKKTDARGLFLTIRKGEGKLFVVNSYSLAGSDTLILPGVDVALWAKRYFGNLKLGEPKATDKNGMAVFEVDDNFPADTTGNITLYVKPVDEEMHGDAEAELTVGYGNRNTRAPLNENRAIWNTVEKAPLWILLTFLIGVFGVWGVIAYICFQLYKLKKES